MKKYKIAFAVLALFLAVMCIYPVSADVIVSEPEFTYEISEQKLNTEITIGGGSETAPASDYPMDIILLLDISKSMEEKYNEKTRLDIAKKTITEQFLPFPYGKIRIGLVTFAKHATCEMPLTRDLEEVRKKAEDAYATDIYTNLGEGIEEVTKNIKERSDKKPLPIIVVFSDGCYDEEIDPIEKAKLAAKEGITIYTIGMGKKDEINEVVLKKIAEEAKGEYYYIEDLPNGKDNDPLETMLGMDKSFSATNVVIKFKQADALLDYYSSEHPVHTSLEPGTKPPVLIEKDKFEFIVPKMEEGQKITFVFDAFPLKGGDVGAATLDLYFIDKNGPQARDKPLVEKGLVTPEEMLEEKREEIAILNDELEETKEKYSALIGVLVIILIALIIFELKRKGEVSAKEGDYNTCQGKKRELEDEKSTLKSDITNLQKQLENSNKELAKCKIKLQTLLGSNEEAITTEKEKKDEFVMKERVETEEAGKEKVESAVEEEEPATVEVEEGKRFIVRDRIEENKGGES
jgi:uncharacterized protein YegL/ribosomal protein L9